MSNATSRAIALVRKVVAVARRPALPDRRMVLGERALVKVLQVSTVVARQLARVPIPPATATQRITMQALAAQLRAAAAGILVSEASRDPSTLEGAMAEAVEETLRLVDIALGVELPELRAQPQVRAALGAGEPVDGDP
jgi:hypothetical protein